jgi:uncharacterized protein
MILTDAERRSDVSALEPKEPPMHFAVIRRDKPNSFALRLSERPRHLEYLTMILNKIVYGGALLDGDGKQYGSMLIIDATDQAAAESFAVADPYVDAGLFSSTSVQPFRLIFRDGTWL